MEPISMIIAALGAGAIALSGKFTGDWYTENNF